MTLDQEIAKRRTFGIISHPDAGKTTLTEKLLLFGGAIQKAGAVKSSKMKDHAGSDWREIEKQRGISVATSVMGFNYKGMGVIVEAKKITINNAEDEATAHIVVNWLKNIINTTDEVVAKREVN